MLARRAALAASLLLAACTAQAADPAPTVAPKQSEILPMLEKCADAQLALLGNKINNDWTASTFYVGLARLSHTSTNPKYAQACYDIAERKSSGRSTPTKARPAGFFADDQAIGQLMIDLAETSLQPLNSSNLSSPKKPPSSAKPKTSTLALQPPPQRQTRNHQNGTPSPWWW